MWRILSFDGGGIAGLVPLVVLRRLFEADLYLVEKAELFAGTSTGGIIALALAHGVSVCQLHNLYARRGANIFRRRLLAGRFGLFRAKYSNDGLRQELKALFGDARLGELKKKVLIPSFDLDGDDGRWKAKFFTNCDIKDAEEPLVEVALRSAAAPTYFPTRGSYCDGGVVANNPALCALGQLWDRSQLLGKPPCAAEFRLLSLGCGAGVNRITDKDIDAGVVFWGTHLVDMLFDGMVDKDDFLCRRFLGENYCRVNPVVSGERPGMDEYEGVDRLQEIGEQADLGQAHDWLRTKW